MGKRRFQIFLQSEQNLPIDVYLVSQGQQQQDNNNNNNNNSNQEGGISNNPDMSLDNLDTTLEEDQLR